MADITNGCPTDSVNFKEAVCIDAGRVYDSCCEQHTTLCTYTHKQKNRLTANKCREPIFSYYSLHSGRPATEVSRESAPESTAVDATIFQSTAPRTVAEPIAAIAA